jgi:hypothetical protein
MNKRNLKFWMVLWLALVLFAALLLASCSTQLRVGELQTTSESVELGDAESVRVEITFGAGELVVAGGSENLLDADFTYNVARLEPEVTYTDSTLVIEQPEARGLPSLLDIEDFRNEWSLRLNNDVPVDIHVNMGAGTNELQLAELSLTGLDVSMGAGESTVDLSGDLADDLDVTIDTGAANLTVLLPREIGVRVEIEAGPTSIEAPDLAKDGNIYTNDAFGESDVTLEINIEAGIGQITLELE